MLALCALSRAEEPVLKPAPMTRQPMPLEQQVAVLQEQVAKLQSQVAQLQSVLQVSQGNVQLQGNTVTIVSGKGATKSCVCTCRRVRRMPSCSLPATS